jgi:hypothetical protein
LRKAKTVAAVEALARSDRCIAATTAQWDADPWLLNTPGDVGMKLAAFHAWLRAIVIRG